MCFSSILIHHKKKKTDKVISPSSLKKMQTYCITLNMLHRLVFPSGGGLAGEGHGSRLADSGTSLCMCTSRLWHQPTLAQQVPWHQPTYTQLKESADICSVGYTIRPSMVNRLWYQSKYAQQETCDANKIYGLTHHQPPVKHNVSPCQSNNPKYFSINV